MFKLSNRKYSVTHLIACWTYFWWLINGDIYPVWRCKEHAGFLHEWRKWLLCVWFKCSGLVMKAVEGNWQESVVTFCLWTFYYVKGKLLLMSQCFVMCYHWKINYFFLTLPHSYIEVGFCVGVCKWPCVSVKWLNSNSKHCTDHPVVFPWPRLQNNQFYVVCGQQTAFDLREW